jgi:hypothetical protein
MVRVIPLTERIASVFATAAYCVLVALIPSTHAAGLPPQPTAPVSQPPAAMPEIIYWKQQLFLIPYQWGSAAEPGAAQVVWLFVSKDRGASWQKISEAKPDVKAFNYRAEGDGEYWFAVRTFDRQGRVWPQGPYQPELRVIVDTTLPRIEQLEARPAANGLLEIQARASDANLDPSTWKFEWQADPMAAGQPIMLERGATIQPVSAAGSPLATLQLKGYCRIPAGARPVAIRGAVSDRAGNTAAYQTRMGTGAVAGGPLLTPPALNPPTITNANTATTQVGSLNTSSIQSNTSTSDWTSASGSPTSPSQPAAPVSQPWPASNVATAPFRLWTGGAVQQDDGMTAYGSPPLVDAPPLVANSAPNREQPRQELRVEARYTAIKRPADDATNSVAVAEHSHPQFATLEPYRESSSNHARTSTESLPSAQAEGWSAGESPSKKEDVNTSLKAVVRDVSPVNSSSIARTPTSPPKLVGSRTFALEYDLDDAGRGGVSKVELWGTRDGGQTWRSYAQDDDNRSPLVVTVDEQGLYGFRILVQTADGRLTEPPHAGDAPELWVSVDLKRPVVELTAIERGQGNQADHLILRWRATDNNLEPRPISLFYSSRAAGPWSAIATNLENTGEYAWRVERFVPTRFYLRVEAHDTAGNLAAFQIREPIEFSTSNLAGRLRSAEAVGASR